MSEFPTSRRFSLNGLPPRHLLCHEKHQSQVTIFHAAKQATELGEHICVFPGVAPKVVLAGLSFPKIR